MQQKFFEDLQKVYDISTSYSNKINFLYECIKQQTDNSEFIDNIIKELELEINEETRYAVVSRFVTLRDETLVQTMNKYEFDEDKQERLKLKSYELVKEFYMKHFEEFIDEVEKQNLLTPFYRTVIKGVHNIGVAISNWQNDWTKHIIFKVNKNLDNMYKDQSEAMTFLKTNGLLDKGHDGLEADRCYSVLCNNDGKDKCKSLAYATFFKSQVKSVNEQLEKFQEDLLSVDNDEVFNQRESYLEYINALKKAFCEEDVNSLVSRWADVDRAWMNITTPLQIGHPLEYYEDHYRKAVALEWDLRVINPKLNNANKRVEKIKLMYKEIFDDLNIKKEYEDIYNKSLTNLDKTQLYIGRPLLYYGAELNGLFSAQVVPNDEVVSLESGKKIFAFADNVLQSQRAKPYMKLPKVVYGEEFVKEQRRFLENETDAWHKVYDISTIGHEFGHILWVDEVSESVMNQNGNFKNIEEFKATTGGLVSFFCNEEDNLNLEILKDVTTRAVGLIAWMEVGEVQPYYCEGLIHLNILFDTKVLDFENEKLIVDISNDSYARAKEEYINSYKKLANTYLSKSDADTFLFDYAKKDENGNFMPIDNKVKSFVNYYYSLYKEIGRELDN
jgi:hypothetical protein